MLVARKLELGSNAVVPEVCVLEEGLDVTFAHTVPTIGARQDIARVCKRPCHQSVERDTEVDDARHA
jgi:hypothetical protein